jgi:hypothetical protein
MKRFAAFAIVILFFFLLTAPCFADPTDPAPPKSTQQMPFDLV